MKETLRKYSPTFVWNLLKNIKKHTYISEADIIFYLSRFDLFTSSSFYKENIKNMVWLNSIKPESILSPGIENTNYFPDFYDGKYNKVSNVIPDVCLYKFNNARVHIDSSQILLSDCIVIDNCPKVLPSLCRFSYGLIQYHNTKLAYIQKRSKVVFADKAFFLGGDGCSNYYHWTVEIVSKLHYFTESKVIGDDVVIVLPEYVKKYDSFYRLVKSFDIERFRLVFIGVDEVLEAKSLYYINSPSKATYVKLGDSHLPDDRINFDKKSIEAIRYNVLNSSAYKNFKNKNKNKKRIFLARKSNSVRKYNQLEVIALVEKYQFEVIYIEDFCFYEQVDVFQNAEFIIGASGAAWTNLIYIREGAKAISWLSGNLSTFAIYSSLAKYYSCELKFIKCQEIENQVHSDYTLDLSKLESLIISLDAQE